MSEFIGGHTMAKRTSILFFLAAIVCICAIVLVYGSGRGDSITSKENSNGQVLTNQKTSAEGQFTRSYGKIKLPAEISIELVETEDTGDTMSIIVSAQSKIPVGSGAVTLKVPDTGAEEARTEELWSGTPSDSVDETIEYVRDALPEGRYQFIATFEFTPNGVNSKMLAVSSSLYLDVRPGKILSSNISFAELKRVEFRKKLEKRILLRMKPELENSGPKLMSAEIANLKALDPGMMDRKIAELAAADPEVARMMMELNRVGEESLEQDELDADGERIGVPTPTYKALVEWEAPASETPKEEK
jgi:hypothetical protein